MCGTVGMFVGCSALSYCPRRLLADGATGAGAADDSEYHSAFLRWHERASVRQAPRRVLREGEDDRFFFSPDLVPVAGHPLVKALRPPVFEELLIQHLYRYLDFTAKLEFLVVNRTVLGIAHGSAGISLPEEMRFDAYKMYCDEAYHTLFSVDLARQVRARTGVEPLLREPFFLIRLGEIISGLPAADRGLAEILFVVISETLISASLAEIPDSSAVVSAVSETVRDHAVDEGRHHAYFAAFLRLLWAALDPAERRQASRLVPQLIDAFLRPDLPTLRQELTAYGITPEDVEQILAETYAPHVVAAHARSTARHTLRYFDELGAFDDQRARDQLHEHGLAG
ncbi:MAG TPA: diiron oxygenase [Trebonia sp.]|nr:diiron oxygenase [Trebonia sp.]